MQTARHMRGGILKWLAVLAGAGALALAAVYGLGKYYDGVLAADPARLPPALQIRALAVELGHGVADRIEPDPDVGFVLEPGLEQQVATADYTFTRIADSRGFPNAGEWPETADVAVLGDSLIMGEGVGVPAGFVSLVDDALEHETLVNFGNMGAGLERQYRILRKFGAGLEPKTVISCLYLLSDLEGDVHFRAWLDEPDAGEYNEFRLTYARASRAPESGLIRRLERHPSYFKVQSLIEPQLWGDLRIPHRREMPDGTTLMFERDKVKFAKRSFSAEDPRFRNLTDTLARLQSFTDELRADLLFVLIPGKEEILAEDVTGKPDSAVAVMKGLLEARGLPYLDLYPVVQKAAQKQSPYFPRDIHFNEYGNKVVADAIVQWLESEPAGGETAAAN